MPRHRCRCDGATVNTKKTINIFATTIIVIVVFAVVVFYLTSLQPKPASEPFSFNLTATPDNSAVVQGSNTTITVEAAYLDGDALPIMLSAAGGPNGTVYQFSNQTGTPTAKHPFSSNLTIYVPTSAASDSYVIDVSANVSARTCQAKFNLTVAYSEIQVSGTVTIVSQININGIILDVIPTDILFTSNTTGETYQAKIHRFTYTDDAPGKTGSYSISLPNLQSYYVDFYCFSFPHYIPVPREATGGTEKGYFTVSCGACTTSLSADFTG